MAKRANHAARGRILVPFPEELLAQADEDALKVESEDPGTLTKRSGVIRRLVELALSFSRGKNRLGKKKPIFLKLFGFGLPLNNLWDIGTVRL